MDILRPRRRLEVPDIAHHLLHQTMEKLGVKVAKVYVGEFATSMEMSGFSISVFKLDAELKQLLARPCFTLFFNNAKLRYKRRDSDGCDKFRGCVDRAPVDAPHDEG